MFKKEKIKVGGLGDNNKTASHTFELGNFDASSNNEQLLKTRASRNCRGTKTFVEHALKPLIYSLDLTH